MDVHGASHKVWLELTDEEVDERREHVLRQVGRGLGLPKRRAKSASRGGGTDEPLRRGELWARVRLVGVPQHVPQHDPMPDARRAEAEPEDEPPEPGLDEPSARS